MILIVISPNLFLFINILDLGLDRLWGWSPTLLNRAIRLTFLALGLVPYKNWCFVRPLCS